MAPSIAGSVSGGATSRSHVPSLTSHAFFHPMSSQRLQAQRSGQRASTIGQPPPAPPGDDAMTDDGRTTVPAQQRQSTASQPQQMGARLLARPLTDDNKNNNGDLAQSPPQSRGTEMTEQETIDRVTANTSPTHGHNPTASITESMRPLQQKTPAAGGSSKKGGLSVNVGGSGSGAAGGGTLPPLKSPRSFRSSFLLPGKGGSGAAGAGGGDGAVNGSNRSTQGAEKLSSAASSPKLQPADDGRGKNGKLSKNKSASPKAANLGRNWEYFEGNTAFGLGGRWQNARSRPINIVTGLFAVMPIVLFCVFSARFLWYNISPAIPITFGYVSFLCLSSFLHASVSDPGVSRTLHTEHLGLSPEESMYMLTASRFFRGTCTDSLLSTRTRTR